MPKIKITVTKEDIGAGVPFNNERCPIALALSRELLAREVEVRSDMLTIDGKRFRLPLGCARFIREFDNLKPVKPFTFLLGGK